MLEQLDIHKQDKEKGNETEKGKKKTHPNFTSYIKIKMGQRAFPVAQW